MSRLRAYTSTAAQGALFAVCLDALMLAAAWVAYVNGWIGADGFFAVLRLAVICAPCVVVLGIPLSVAMLAGHDAWLERRRS